MWICQSYIVQKCAHTHTPLTCRSHHLGNSILDSTAKPPGKAKEDMTSVITVMSRAASGPSGDVVSNAATVNEPVCLQGGLGGAESQSDGSVFIHITDPFIHHSCIHPLSHSHIHSVTAHAGLQEIWLVFCMKSNISCHMTSL